MNKDWFTLIKQHTVAGARDKFETICGTLFKKMYPDKNVRLVKVKQGDGGIDVFIGEIGIKPIEVIQCKFFPGSFEDSQKSQIRDSFKTAINSKEYQMSKWTLCVFCTLDLKENKWWVYWKNKMITAYNLNDDFIKLIDGDDLVDLLNENNLYNIAFDKEDSIKIDKIYKKITTDISLNQLEKSIQKASTFLLGVKIFFGKDPTSHIERTETKNIIYWVKNDLEDSKKNILVLEGDKGLGKSVILKDVYENLIKENYLVLGIKADKYYARNPKELENKLFLNDKISFSKIIDIINVSKKQLVIIIDQLDALSQTLSSSREYLQTYNRIINELVNEENIRVIISSRTYDLKYDAELSIYNSNDYKNIKTSLLSVDNVQKTLGKLQVSCSVKKVIELLRTPNHLEIFCKLPNKDKINLNTLSSLKDLYDELWNTLILHQNNLELDKVLYKIAIEMYQQQQIVVKKQLVSKFHSELNYLFSNQLLTIENNHIQFFHQTFYDYCFSRQFVENGNDIFTYLKQNQQNLEIRSIVKMVFEYLREYDHRKYVKYIKSILKSNKYRFHLKSLIISNLGLVNPTNEEKKLLETHILNNNKYKDVFINSVFSEKWIEYLIENKTAEKYLFTKKNYLNSIYELYKKQSLLKLRYFENFNYEKIIEEKRNTIWVIFSSNINKAPYKIITHLHNLPHFKEKNVFIERILYHLNNWEDKMILPYFEKYISFEIEPKERDNFWFYEILERIFEYHPVYVYDKLKPILINKFNSSDSWFSIKFTHKQEGVLNKMYNTNPEDVFSFLFKIYKEVIDKNKRTELYEKVDSPYYGCSKFYDGFSSSKQGYIFIQDILLKHLFTKKENKDYVLNFYNKLKYSNSISLIRLIILFFKETRNIYNNEIFELINIIHSKKGFNGYDDLFQLYLRQLIGVTFVFFSDSQKEKIIEILLSIKYPNDLKSWKYNDSEGNEKVHFTKYGIKQYLFLSLIPDEEIEKNIRLKKVFQEFKRKFGEVDANKARDVSSSGGAYIVGAPLEHNAYANMNLKSWKKSFLKFNDDYIEGNSPKGGITEHSRAFNDTVKQKPNKYYNFILNLFEDKKVSLNYISSGIEGLIEGKHTPSEVQVLYKKLINLNLDRNNTLYTIWKADYLIEHKLIDEEIIKFLAKNALNHPSPEKALNENDSLSESLNSVRGAAIHKIIKCYRQEEFSELIFETIEKATNDTQTSVKVAILHGLAYLNYLDIERSFKIFIKLVGENNIELLKNSLTASHYFNNKYHDKMYSYFNNLMLHNTLHRNSYVIVWSWMNEKINDKKLFNKFIKKSKEAKLCAIEVAEKNLIDKNGMINSKSIHIFNLFLNQNDKEFSNAYSGLILRKFKSNNFKQLYPFLVLYSKTDLCMDEPRYFLMLLLKCAKDYPLECLKLLDNMNFNKNPNIQGRGYYREEPVQLILAIYSKLNMNLKQNKKHIIKALDVFDDMLIHNHLRRFANNAIELTV